MASARQVATGASALSGTLAALVTFGMTEYFNDRDASRVAKIERARIAIEAEIETERAEAVERLLDRQEKQFRVAFDQIAKSCR